MHSTFSGDKEDSTSRQVHCPIQSFDFVENKLDTISTDSDTEKQVPSKFDVPGDGSCLFWAVTMAYLVPVRDDDDLFRMRYNELFGKDETAIKNLIDVKSSIQNYNPLSNTIYTHEVLSYFVRSKFRNRVVDFIESNLDKFECFSEVADEQYRLQMRNPDRWSGDAEIQAISLILNCNINVDGQIFPLISNTKQADHNYSKKITLDLFLVNRTTGDTEDANHFNYGLEEKLVKDIRQKQRDRQDKFLAMIYNRKREKLMKERDAEHDYNDESVSPNNSKKSDTSLKITSVCSLSDELDEIDDGFNELEDDCTNELDYGFRQGIGKVKFETADEWKAAWTEWDNYELKNEEKD